MKMKLIKKYLMSLIVLGLPILTMAQENSCLDTDLSNSELENTVCTYYIQEGPEFQKCIDDCFVKFRHCLDKGESACDQKLSYCSDWCRFHFY